MVTTARLVFMYSKVMAKQIVAPVFLQSSNALSQGSLCPLTSRTVSCFHQRPLSRRRHYDGTLDRSSPGHSRYFHSANALQHVRRKNKPSRYPERDRETPSWLDVGPDSEFGVVGTVTEIEVLGAGSFPLYRNSSYLFYLTC